VVRPAELVGAAQTHHLSIYQAVLKNNFDDLFRLGGLGVHKHSSPRSNRESHLGKTKVMTMHHDFELRTCIHVWNRFDLFIGESSRIDFHKDMMERPEKRLRTVVPFTPKATGQKLVKQFFEPVDLFLMFRRYRESVSNLVRASSLYIR